MENVLAFIIHFGQQECLDLEQVYIFYCYCGIVEFGVDHLCFQSGVRQDDVDGAFGDLWHDKSLHGVVHLVIVLSGLCICFCSSFISIKLHRILQHLDRPVDMAITEKINEFKVLLLQQLLDSLRSLLLLFVRLSRFLIGDFPYYLHLCNSLN